MAQWTNIPDETLEPGRPIRSVDGLALRDNPVAIAEGASGAPRVVNGALEGDISDDKLSTSATNTGRDWVLARSALASVGTVGAYALLGVNLGSGPVSPGSTVSGSNLRYTNAGGDQASSPVPSGTWRAMGRISAAGGDSYDDLRTTLWLRIS